MTDNDQLSMNITNLKLIIIGIAYPLDVLCKVGKSLSRIQTTTRYIVVLLVYLILFILMLIIIVWDVMLAKLCVHVYIHTICGCAQCDLGHKFFVYGFQSAHSFP